MPVTIKSNLVKIRDNPNAAYTSMDVISDSITAERVNQINNASITAQAQIENKKNTVLNNIPADYITLTNNVEDFKNDIVVVSDEEPQTEDTKVWINPYVEEMQIPTYAEYNELKNTKINKPITSPNGKVGQLLRTNGDGSTVWVDQGLPTDEQTEDAVVAWLNAHPEATTTVQDNSISFSKFNDTVKTKFYTITPDDFSGTDTQKIQAAFDSFGANGCGTLVINRNYTITSNIKIRHQSYYGINNRITVIGLGSECQINMNSFSFVGYNDSVRNFGNIVFENINFIGTGALFDFTNLIRIYLFNCSIDGFEYVIYSNSYIQSVNINMCLLRDITGIIIYSNGTTLNNSLSDVVITSSLIERCNHLIDTYSSGNVIIDKNCIEAFHELPIKIRGYASNVVITENYFESNNSAYNDGDTDGNGVTIDLTDIQYSGVVTIENNYFAQRTTDTIILLPNTTTSAGSISIKNNGGARLTELIVASNSLTTPYRNLIIEGNFGNINDVNLLISKNDSYTNQSVTYSNTNSTISGTYTFKRIGKIAYLSGVVTLNGASSGLTTILPKANYADLFRPDGQYQHIAYNNTNGNAIKLKWSAGATLQADIPQTGNYELIIDIFCPTLY